MQGIRRCLCQLLGHGRNCHLQWLEPWSRDGSIGSGLARLCDSGILLLETGNQVPPWLPHDVQSHLWHVRELFCRGAQVFHDVLVVSLSIHCARLDIGLTLSFSTGIQSYWGGQACHVMLAAIFPTYHNMKNTLPARYVQALCLNLCA